MNRRDIVLATALGAASGVAWAGGLGVMLNRHDPTLEIIGRKHTLMALLDTGSVRALFVVGDVQVDRLGPLLGVFRRRIDLLVGTQTSVAAIRAGHSRSLTIGRMLILDAPVGIALSPSPQFAVGPASLMAMLPAGLTLELDTFVRDAWQRDISPTQTWMISVVRHGHRCVIAPTLDVIDRHAPADLALAVVADIGPELQGDMLRSGMLAIPADAFPSSLDQVPHASAMRIFPHDPLTITFRQDGLAIRE
ncbi:MAG: hypothetical protein WBA46_03255 [Thermomicrobiales bacterium]